jgi:hypothetical protein
MVKILLLMMDGVFNLMNKKYKIVRNEILNEKVVFVDGLPGNGKTLFS